MKDLIEEFKDLAGHTIVSIQNTSDELTFTLANGQTCTLYHEQDCCESVSIEDISGDFSLLLHSPLTAVEEVQSDENPPGLTMECQDSFTWTTYTFATENGAVSIRWYGESNGYYSEDVYFRVHKSLAIPSPTP